MSRGLPPCIVALCVATLCAIPATAPAATLTTTFGVGATVQAACDVSATSMVFGPYTSATVNATSALSVTCTDSTPYNVALSAGISAGSTAASRQMTGPGASLLRYMLTSDSARTRNWGATPGSDTVAGTGNGAVQHLIIYGQTPGAQFVTPGAYADTITVTVTY
jgi:spore coat protein U-like protein